MAAFRLGLIINPIAGMGGSVGLKGSDTSQVVAQAQMLGAIPQSQVRAHQTLAAIMSNNPTINVLAASGEMGEMVATKCGIKPRIIDGLNTSKTTALDTICAAKQMVDLQVDLILFAGGDGTARDLVKAIGNSIPVVGIPAGVKMHSAVYAIHPMAAARIVAKFIEGNRALRELEVMDIDENAFREGAVSAKLYGYLSVPYVRDLVQGAKAGGVNHNQGDLFNIARYIVHSMRADHVYILGPGTTMRAVAERVGVSKTLLGVDIIKNGCLLVGDATEQQILSELKGTESIIVTPIGGQGHFFGRGNQQISAKVISKVGKDNIIVAATPGKLASLYESLLHVDTGDPILDEIMCGWRRVVTGFNTVSICRVSK